MYLWFQGFHTKDSVLLIGMRTMDLMSILILWNKHFILVTYDFITSFFLFNCDGFFFIIELDDCSIILFAIDV